MASLPDAEDVRPTVAVETDGNNMRVTISDGQTTVTRKFFRDVYSPSVYLDTVMRWAWDDWAKATHIDGPEAHQHTMVTDDDGHQWCLNCDEQFDGQVAPEHPHTSSGAEE